MSLQKYITFTVQESHKKEGNSSSRIIKIFKCEKCSYASNRRNNLYRHLYSMHSLHSEPLECCGYFYEDKASLRDHIRTFHKDGYRCFYCQRVFCRRALMKRHYSVHSSNEEICCPVSSYSTYHKNNFDRHLKTHKIENNLIGNIRIRGDMQQSSENCFVMEKFNSSYPCSSDKIKLRNYADQRLSISQEIPPGNCHICLQYDNFNVGTNMEDDVHSLSTPSFLNYSVACQNVSFVNCSQTAPETDVKFLSEYDAIYGVDLSVKSNLSNCQNLAKDYKCQLNLDLNSNLRTETESNKSFVACQEEYVPKKLRMSKRYSNKVTQHILSF